MCGIVKEIIRSGYYRIIIRKEYKNYNLSKYDVCEVNIILIKRVDYSNLMNFLEN